MGGFICFSLKIFGRVYDTTVRYGLSCGRMEPEPCTGNGLCEAGGKEDDSQEVAQISKVPR